MRMALVDPTGVVVGLLDWDTAKTFTPPAGHVLRPAGDARVGDIGVIPNVALTSLVVPGVVNLSATNFTVPTPWAELVGIDLVVPAGCTRLMVNAATWVYAKNTSTGIDVLGVTTSLTVPLGMGSIGPTFLTQVPANAFGTVSAPLAFLAEYLTPGDTVRLFANRGASMATWTASPFNVAALTATLLWLR